MIGIVGAFLFFFGMLLLLMYVLVLLLSRMVHSDTTLKLILAIAGIIFCVCLAILLTDITFKGWIL